MRMPFIALLLVVGASVGGGGTAAPDAREGMRHEDHIAWVAQVLTRMQKIKPGMTRGQLLAVFTTEGGLSTPLHRTFVSRDCPYFKVDVEFEPVGRPGRDSDGRVTMAEGDLDRITVISKPYLAFSIVN